MAIVKAPIIIAMTVKIVRPLLCHKLVAAELKISANFIGGLLSHLQFVHL